MSDQLQIRDTSSLYFHWASRLAVLFALAGYFWLRSTAVGELPDFRVAAPISVYFLVTILVGLGKWATHITFVTIGILCNALIFGLLSSYLYFSPSVFLFLALVFVSYSLVPIATSWVYLLSLYVVGLALGFITQVDQGMSILRWVPADSVPVFLTVALAILGIRFLRVRDSAQ